MRETEQGTEFSASICLRDSTWNHLRVVLECVDLLAPQANLMTGLHLTTSLWARLSPLLLVMACLPARGMDVKLTFHYPKNMGTVEASFSGFDNDRNGFIESAAGEVVSAWAENTGTWGEKGQTPASRMLSGTIDIKYAYSSVQPPASNTGYPGSEFMGLARFVIETKSPNGNHVNSNGLTFLGETRFGFFKAQGVSWSDTYNAPSSYLTTFEGPENAVRLTLTATGSPFAPAVPEVGTLGMFAGGAIILVAMARRRRPGLTVGNELPV